MGAVYLTKSVTGYVGKAVQVPRAAGSAGIISRPLGREAGMEDGIQDGSCHWAEKFVTSCYST